MRFTFYSRTGVILDIERDSKEEALADAQGILGEIISITEHGTTGHSKEDLPDEKTKEVR